MLGTSRPHNRNTEQEEISLRLVMHQRQVNYKLKPSRDANTFNLWLNPDNHKGLSLPSNGTAAVIHHEGRCRWVARSLWDGRELAVAQSQTEIVRRTIQKVWN
jgi:hypothetical protein